MKSSVSSVMRWATWQLSARKVKLRVLRETSNGGGCERQRVFGVDYGRATTRDGTSEWFVVPSDGGLRVHENDCTREQVQEVATESSGYETNRW